MINFLKKFTFLQKILGLDNSGQVAKDRLRLVLIHDRSSISPQLMENLKFDLIKVISKYMVIDEETIEMGLDNRNGTVALAANIPILRIKAIEDNNEQLELLDEKPEIKKTVKETKSGIEKLQNTDKEALLQKTRYVSDDSALSIKTRRKAYNTYRTKRTTRRRKKIAV